jgi:uncharacterized membrane protein YhfC
MRPAIKKRIRWLMIGIALASIFYARAIHMREGKPTLFLLPDGRSSEAHYLLRQEQTVRKNDQRVVVSSAGEIVYRIPLGEAVPTRAEVLINRAGVRMEFSADGDIWSPLFSHADDGTTKTDSDRSESCKLSPEQREAAVGSGVAWFRIRPLEAGQARLPGIKLFKLEVSGASPSADFRRISFLSPLLPMLPMRLMVAIGILSVILCRRRWKTAWRLFALGGLLWTVSVAMKFGYAIWANTAVYHALEHFPGGMPGYVIFFLYVGLLTGVFECGIFLPFLGAIRRRQWSWRQAASVGVGFGAIESFILGIAAMVALRMTATLEPPELSWNSFAGVYERLMVLVAHVASVAMIVHGFQRRRWSWFWGAVLFKTLLDAVACFIGLYKPYNAYHLEHPWFSELVMVTPFAVAGLFILVRLKKSWTPSLPDADTSMEPSAPPDTNLEISFEKATGA